MLRSLVGSEMCIRDSPGAGPRGTRAAWRLWRQAVHSSGAVGGGARGLCACLLYTSDAADDLLCVDLGGRRIIKKKTKVRTPTPTYRPPYRSPPRLLTKTRASDTLHVHKTI